VKINLTIEGDHENGKFSMFLVTLKRDEFEVTILLTAEQTNLAFEYDDPFEPILELKNILADGGFSVFQTIQIINGDNSDEQLEFEAAFNEITEDPWQDEITPIEMKFTNTDDPENGNIELLSACGHEFTIYTESDEMLPTETVQTLRLILNQEQTFI
jgi:hypothetical protein